MSELPTADRVSRVGNRVYRWAAYSPRHKVELTSHAWLRGDELVVFDPIPLRDDLRSELMGRARRTRVFVTSENHQRAVLDWAAAGCPVSTRRASGISLAGVELIEDVVREWFGLELIPLAGGPSGECVLLGRTSRVAFGGDALVNLPARGLEVLPAKYCRDRSRLIHSLGRLADKDIDFLYPAHGLPVGPRAAGIIAELLSAL